MKNDSYTVYTSESSGRILYLSHIDGGIVAAGENGNSAWSACVSPMNVQWTCGEMNFSPFALFEINPAGQGDDGSGLTWKTPVGAGLVGLGHNGLITRGKTAGATKGTSIASEYLSRKFPQQLNKVAPKTWNVVRSVVPKSVLGQPLLSPVLGRMMGRAVPLLGEALMLYDAVNMMYDEINSLMYDTPEEYWRKARQNVTTIGMYHDQ